MYGEFLGAQFKMLLNKLMDNKMESGFFIFLFQIF